MQLRSWTESRAPLSTRMDPQLPRLVIAASGEWFQIGDQPAVPLDTRGPIRRLLFTLADLKKNSPGVVLPVTGAFAAGWPGERATPAAAAMRVYTAIHSLRGLGLRGVLVRRRRGYVLDADITIVDDSSESIAPPKSADDLEIAV